MTPADTPQPQTQAQQAPSPTDNVPMQFKDGSQSMVPKEKVVDAMYDGGELLHPMKFPDGSQAMVAHSKLAGAMQDGGQRLDTQPIPAATWQQYVGAAFGVLTDPTIGVESGEESGGKKVAEGLTEATSGHPIKGAVKVASQVGQVAGAALGMPETGGTMEQASSAVASDLPAPSLKALYSIAKDTAQKAELAAGGLESAGAKKFMQVAYNGAAEARQAGNVVKATGYDAAALAAKGYGKFAEAETWLNKTIPGAPLALKIWAAAHLVREGYDWVTGDKDADAREQLFSEK